MLKTLSFKILKLKKNLIFNSFWLAKIINMLTKHTLTQKIENKIYKTFSVFKIKKKIPALFYTYNTIRHQKLLFRILKIRIAGRIYQLPNNFDFFNRYNVAFKLLLKNIYLKGINSFSERLSKYLLLETFIRNNSTDKLRNEIYKTISSFRGYLHFRWRN